MKKIILLLCIMCSCASVPWQGYTVAPANTQHGYVIYQNGDVLNFKDVQLAPQYNNDLILIGEKYQYSIKFKDVKVLHIENN